MTTETTTYRCEHRPRSGVDPAPWAVVRPDGTVRVRAHTLAQAERLAESYCPSTPDAGRDLL